MFFAINLIILYGLIQLLNLTKNPYLCAGSYVLVLIVLNLFVNPGIFINNNLLFTISDLFLNFIFFLAYFWLLNKTEGHWLWWVVLIIGFILLFVL
ncbi:MAG: hypothetical protein WC570_02515 [Patescibacteria group bacterium]